MAARTYDREKKREEWRKKQAKRYGVELMLHTADKIEDYEYTPTGLPIHDYHILGIGGLPKGSLVLVHGLESSCKTSICLEWASRMLLEDETLTCLLIDVEQAVIKSHLQMFPGLLGDRFEVLWPKLAEDALQSSLDAIGAYDIIIVDSLAKLLTKDRDTKDLSDAAVMAAVASKITAWTDKLSYPLRKNKTIFLAITQERDNLEAMKFGEKTHIPGGKALKFTTGIILQLKRIGKLTNTQIIGGKSVKKHIGNRIKFHTRKNKCGGMEGAETVMDFIFGRGFSEPEAYLNQLLLDGTVKPLGKKEYEFMDEDIYSEKFKMKDLSAILGARRKEVDATFKTNIELTASQNFSMDDSDENEEEE